MRDNRSEFVANEALGAPKTGQPRPRYRQAPKSGLLARFGGFLSHNSGMIFGAMGWFVVIGGIYHVFF